MDDGIRIALGMLLFLVFCYVLGSMINQPPRLSGVQRTLVVSYALSVLFVVLMDGSFGWDSLFFGLAMWTVVLPVTAVVFDWVQAGDQRSRDYGREDRERFMRGPLADDPGHGAEG